MTIDSYSFIEHFDYMRNYIPQPFIIKSEDVVDLIKSVSEPGHDEYSIVTKTRNYTLSKSSIKKLVDALGVKIKLLSAVCEEADVIDLVLPAVNKLFKCFADCFVFYATADEALTIIDLNVNMEKGAEGTRYENGPSPWKIDIKKSPSMFTCFADFKNVYAIDSSTDSDLLVKADELLSHGKVTMSLFKTIPGANLQPMLTFSSWFSNMGGFSEIHPTLYDPTSGIYIMFPMNYAKDEGATFDDLWKKAVHLYETFDQNDYIFREINELASSKDTPNMVKNFINDIIVDSTININQPIKNILEEAVTVSASLKAGKKKKFMKQLGLLIAFAIVMRHEGCEHCGSIHIK
jgi:hypothetical protein